MENENNSRIPDANYLRKVARAEYRWNHRGEPDPSEGLPKRGISPVDAAITAEETMPGEGTINF